MSRASQMSDSARVLLNDLGLSNLSKGLKKDNVAFQLYEKHCSKEKDIKEILSYIPEESKYQQASVMVKNMSVNH